MHAGQMIESIVRSQGRSPSWVAQQLHMVRVNVYDIFRRESVDSSLLQRLSIILDVDLFKMLSDDLQKDKNERQVGKS